MAVLGHISLRDVHVRHDLDAANQRSLEVLGRRRLFLEDTVDSVLDLEFLFERLDVDVAGSRLDGFEQDQVHEIDE